MAIKIKTNAEIDLMRNAGRLLATVFKEVESIIEAGISTKEIDKFIGASIRKKNARASSKGYGNPPFPGSACISVNDAVIHGVPSKKKVLKNGDIVGVDITLEYKGYNADKAFTFQVGECSPDAKRLVDKTQLAFFNGVKIIKEGIHLGDVSNAIQTTVESNGFSVVREFQGHGIGASMHEDPSIANYGTQGTGVILKKNMTLAIEPMVTFGKHHVVIEDDDWTVVTRDGSLASHYENTVLVLEDGFEILTVLEDDEIVKKYL